MTVLFLRAGGWQILRSRSRLYSLLGALLNAFSTVASCKGSGEKAHKTKVEYHFISTIAAFGGCDGERESPACLVAVLFVGSSINGAATRPRRRH